MRRTDIAVAGGGALLCIGGTAMLTVLSTHSTAVIVISALAILGGVAAFAWAFLHAKDEDEGAAITVGELGTGLLERNTTSSGKLYDGQKADELTVRENTIGTSRRDHDSRSTGRGGSGADKL